MAGRWTKTDGLKGSEGGLRKQDPEKRHRDARDLRRITRLDKVTLEKKLDAHFLKLRLER